MTRVLIVENNLVDFEAMREVLKEAGMHGEVDFAMDAPRGEHPARLTRTRGRP